MSTFSPSKASAGILVPDGVSIEEALSRTTHLAFGAHHDDLEIAAYASIEECFGKPDAWFTGVVVTDGRGSSRTGPYADFSDDEMRDIRRREQNRAAMVGEYSAVIQLDYQSSEIKSGVNADLVEDLLSIAKSADASTIVSHQPLDRHATHIAVFYHLLEALRKLSPDEFPEAWIGAEVWGKLDWLSPTQKLTFDSGKREHLAQALIGVFDSQIEGGKRYDLGEMGHRRGNATYGESHEGDEFALASLGIDLLGLLKDPSLSAKDFALDAINRFQSETVERLSVWQ